MLEQYDSCLLSEFLKPNFRIIFENFSQSSENIPVSSSPIARQYSDDLPATLSSPNNIADLLEDDHDDCRNYPETGNTATKLRRRRLMFLRNKEASETDRIGV